MVNSNKEGYSFDSTYDDDIYIINTTKLNNKWYNDLNFDDGFQHVEQPMVKMIFLCINYYIKWVGFFF